MREIKFKYYYSNGSNVFSKIFTLEEIEQQLPTEEISDSPMLKGYKIIDRCQWTGLEDKNNIKIYEGDFVKCWFKRRSYLPSFIEEVSILNTNSTLPFYREWNIENKTYKDFVGKCEVISGKYD